MSQLVLDECAAGDPNAAAARLGVLAGLPVLASSELVDALIEDLVAAVPFPPWAAGDAFHIVLAAVHGVDYLLTWNCTRIANAILRGRAAAVCFRNGYTIPMICTPGELVGAEQ